MLTLERVRAMNPNHDPETGQFAESGGSGSSGWTPDPKDAAPPPLTSPKAKAAKAKLDSLMSRPSPIDQDHLARAVAREMASDREWTPESLRDEILGVGEDHVGDVDWREFAGPAAKSDQKQLDRLAQSMDESDSEEFDPQAFNWEDYARAAGDAMHKERVAAAVYEAAKAWKPRRVKGRLLPRYRFIPAEPPARAARGDESESRKASCGLLMGDVVVDDRFIAAGRTLPATLRGADRKSTLKIEAGDLKRFSGLAYSGGPLSLADYPHPVVVDLDGVKVEAQDLPAPHNHDLNNVVGRMNSVTINADGISVAGELDTGTDDGALIAAAGRGGLPWEMSIGAPVHAMEFYDSGETVTVNARLFRGPVFVARETTLQEVSFVRRGADVGQTYVAIAAAYGNPFRRIAEKAMRIVAYNENHDPSNGQFTSDSGGGGGGKGGDHLATTKRARELTKGADSRHLDRNHASRQLAQRAQAAAERGDFEEAAKLHEEAAKHHAERHSTEPEKGSEHRKAEEAHKEAAKAYRKKTGTKGYYDKKPSGSSSEPANPAPAPERPAPSGDSPPRAYKSPAHETARNASREAFTWKQQDYDAAHHKKAKDAHKNAAKLIRTANTDNDPRLENLAKKHDERAAWHRSGGKKSAASDREAREETQVTRQMREEDREFRQSLKKK